MARPHTTLREVEAHAAEYTAEILLEYHATGSGDEQTLRDSIEAFKRYRLMPKIFGSKGVPSLSTSLQGHQVAVPFGISPTAIHATAHPDGEMATARAAADTGALMIVSSISQTTIENIRAAAPDAHLWMQTYLFKDRGNTEQLVRRAERLNFRAIVVTVDSPVVGRFTRTMNHYEDLLDKAHELRIQRLANIAPSSAVSPGDEHLFQYAKNQVDGSYPQLEDLAWLKTITKLPIILKGIITADSAKLAAEAGVDGIIVSAHGGRQLDGVQAPLDALSSIVGAVRGYEVEVYMDGGVRSGRDVFKALALGARAVFLGRPILWGLVLGGTRGVSEVLGIVKQELVNTMSLAGCNHVDEITGEFIRHETQLSEDLLRVQSKL